MTFEEWLKGLEYPTKHTNDNKMRLIGYEMKLLEIVDENNHWRFIDNDIYLKIRDDLS